MLSNPGILANNPSRQQQQQQQETQNNKPHPSEMQDASDKVSKVYEEDEVIYYDQFSECQDYVIESCLESLEYQMIQKCFPTEKLSKFNQALLLTIQRQIHQWLQRILKKKLEGLSERYQMKDQLVKIQKIKQEQQILSSLGFSDNVVDQDENQVFFELLLKNLKFLSAENTNEMQGEQ